MSNLPPVVFDRRFSLRQGEMLYLSAAQNVLPGYYDPEGGPLRIASIGTSSAPPGLSFTLTGGVSGDVFVAPAPGFTGTFLFFVGVEDDATARSLAFVTLTITAGAVAGTALSDVLFNPASGGSMFGFADNDTFFGGAGDDLMFGETGDDLFFAGAGRNELRGGPGNDVYSITQVSDVVVESAGEGDADTVYLSISDWTTAAAVEVIRLVGAAQRFIFGGATGVTVVANASLAATVGGGSGNDTVWGSGGGGTLLGGEGDDTLYPAGTAHELRGGKGNDRYSVASLGDTVVEEPGEGSNDEVFVAVSGWSTDAAHVETFYLVGDTTSFAFTGATPVRAVANATLSSTVSGGSGDDELWGTEAGGALIGGAGQDTLRAFAGIHDMRGGPGDDHYHIGALGITISELPGEGYDTAWVEVDYWPLPAHVEVARLIGGASAVVGNNVFSQLVANADRGSLLVGRHGYTQFYGGPHADRIFAGENLVANEIWTGGHVGRQGFDRDADGTVHAGTPDSVIFVNSAATPDTIHHRAGPDGAVTVQGFVAGGAAGDRIVFDAPAGAVLRVGAAPNGTLLGFDGIAGGVFLEEFQAPRSLVVGRDLLFGNAVAIAPTGVADGVTTLVGQAITIDVLANDFTLAPAAPALSAGGYGDVVGGSIALAGSGLVTFTPDAGFVGTGGFTYRPFDGALQGEATRVTVEVVLPPPVFRLEAAAALTVFEGTPPGAGGLLTFRILREPGGALDAANVVYAFGAGAPPGIDAGDLTDGIGAIALAFAAGQTDAVVTLPIQPDSAIEPDETVRVTLTSTSFGTVAPGRLDFLILNDDPANAAPAATPDSITIGENNAFWGRHFADVLANDTDAEGDALFLTAVDTGGTPIIADIFENRLRFYLDDRREDTSGIFVVGYTVRDGQASARGSLTITVEPENDAPRDTSPAPGFETIAQGTNGVFLGTEDTPLIILKSELLADDVDPEGDAVSWGDVVSGGVLGFVLEEDAASLTFMPHRDASGQRIGFFYRSQDASGALSLPIQVIISLADTPDPIVAGYDVIERRPATTQVISLAELFANDIDPDAGDSKTIVDLLAGNGISLLDLDGLGNVVVTYDPAATGLARFTYQVQDSTGTSDAAEVILNRRPLVADDSFVMSEGEDFLFLPLSALLANDGDADGDDLALTPWFWGYSGSNVTVSRDLQGGVAGVRVTLLDDEYVGPAQFIYRVSDGRALSPNAVVTLDVVAGDDPPEGEPDFWFHNGAAPFDTHPATNDMAGVEGEVLLFPVARLIFGPSTLDGAFTDAGRDRNDSGTLEQLRIADIRSAHGAVAIVEVSGVAMVRFEPHPGVNSVGLFGGEGLSAVRLEYGLRDSTGDTSAVSTSVHVWLASRDDPVIANHDAFTVPGTGPYWLDIGAVGSAFDVRANDVALDTYSPSANAFLLHMAQITAVRAVSGVSVTWDGSHTAVFTPDGSGDAMVFEYTLQDPDGDADTATVTLTPALTGPQLFYFSGSDAAAGGAGGRELWVLDPGAPSEARLVADINQEPQIHGYQPERLVAVPDPFGFA